MPTSRPAGPPPSGADLGHVVRLVSLTNGQAGHHAMHGGRLARRRRPRLKPPLQSIGATYEVFDHPDGELDDRLEYRLEVIRLIRSFRPDLIITHRSTDYHPDHRFTGLLVQDASYLVTVPAICPDVPHLPSCPVILYFSDAFTKPCRFEPHVVVDIDDEFDRLVAMLHCHQSQFYEWLPYNAGYLDQVPQGETPGSLAGRAIVSADRAAGRPLSRPGRPDLRPGAWRTGPLSSRPSRSRSTVPRWTPRLGARCSRSCRPDPGRILRSPERSGLTCPRGNSTHRDRSIRRVFREHRPVARSQRRGYQP